MLHTSSATRGQALMLAALFFLAISLTLGVGVAHPVMSQLQSARSIIRGAEGIYAAEGLSEDVLYRLHSGLPVDSTETLNFGNASATATTTTVFDGKEVVSSGSRDTFIRKSKAHLKSGVGESFNYGLQAGVGGIFLENSSGVAGNIYSNGSVDGAGSNLVSGDIVSGGPSGLVKDLHAVGSVYAHSIQNANVDKDAYYTSISGSTVLGTLHPGSADQATSSLPITDAQITTWENDATAGGVISSPCPYKITTDTTIGPKKINCDLQISGSPIVTLTGPVWVSGNIDISNSPTIRVDTALGSKSVPMIAHAIGNESGSGIITIKNSTVFSGSGTVGSYVMLISQNKRAEEGGSGNGEEAIVAGNTISGTTALLLYAAHGEILLQNSMNLKEVTGYRIRLKNSAEVIYETGLANIVFSSGPGGGYTFDLWKEVE